ncbi:MAG: MltA domain-containing protein [Desulfovibrionaceae bacterium]|nr:MltA domain-containing protein [Desulfovibrionaceae bacterium]
MKRLFALFFGVWTAFLLCSCASSPLQPYQYGPGSGATVFPPAVHSGWEELPTNEAVRAAALLSPQAQGLQSWHELAPSLAHCRSYIARMPPHQAAVNAANLHVTWSELDNSLARLEVLLPYLDRHPELLAEGFRWYRRGPDTGFTGYYEPTLAAGPVKTERFNYPLYKVPPDVRKGQSYHSRSEIDEKGVLQGRRLELAWVEDRIGAYFLHVQGSGRLLFPDGSVKHVLYAGKNNRAYLSLGRIMEKKGLLPAEEISMQSIREYLERNPDQISALLNENPSYVFFRLADEGPVGAMNAPLRPAVSLAVDSDVIPLGAVCLFSVPMPDKNGIQGKGGQLTGIGLAQDRGGAIRGNRADLFCGAGHRAEHVAGHLDTEGALFLLIAR